MNRMAVQCNICVFSGIAITVNCRYSNMELWIHASEYVGKDDVKLYWFRVKDAGDKSIVKVDDYALSASYLDLDNLVTNVTLKRSIYVVGHAEDNASGHTWNKTRSKQIYRLDTSKLELGWAKLDVELAKERFKPHIIQLDGKFYIFESVPDVRRPPPRTRSLEVYDPAKGTMNLLPQETIDTGYYYLLGVDHDCKRIVFYSSNTNHLAFYSPYNQDDNKWKIKEIREELFKTMFRVMRYKIAINHKTFYWVDGNHHLVAYNLDSNMFSVPVNLGFISKYTMVTTPMYEDEYTETCSLLYHMEGDCFCFLWHRVILNDNRLYCTFLRISNAFLDDRFSLVVSEIATHSHPIRDRGFEIRSVSPILET